MTGESLIASPRLCLKALAPHTLEVMRELGTTTSEDIATMIINRLLRADPRLTGQETIRRRIYDVINVLSAARIIDKVGKQIVWHGAHAGLVPVARGPQASDTGPSRIEQKERLLRDKFGLLTLYKALMKRNFIQEPPTDAIGLPAIMIGIRDPENTTFTQSLNRCELHVRSSRNMQFWGPGDILKKIDLAECVKEILLRSGELSRYGQELLEEQQRRHAT
jgi:hypothetical protein